MKQFIIPGLIAFAIWVLTAYMNTKIKFAASEQEALRSLDSLVTLILGLIAIVWCVYNIYQDAISPQPVTRWAVVSISFSFFLIGVLMWEMSWLRFLSSINHLLQTINKTIAG
jgi:hypothetical protein